MKGLTDFRKNYIWVMKQCCLFILGFVFLPTLKAQNGGFYSLEIRVVDEYSKKGISSATVQILDSLNNYEFAANTDSNGLLMVQLPANRRYRLLSTSKDYYDSHYKYINLDSNNAMVILSNQEMDIYYSMPFSKFSNVIFDKGTSEINSIAMSVLDSFVSKVVVYQKYKMIFEVVGNARFDHNDKRNFELSLTRAKNVTDYLNRNTNNCRFIPHANSHYRLQNDCDKRKCSEMEQKENDRVQLRFVNAVRIK